MTTRQTNAVAAVRSSLSLYIMATFLLTWIVNVAALTTYPLVPHHVEEQRRGRRLVRDIDDEEHSYDMDEHSSVRRRTHAQQMGALYQGYGTHYVDLWCGTPPQRQTVIVDTGSSVTAFPCSGCQQCGVPDHHVDNLFLERESDTFTPISCDEGCVASRAHCSGDNCKLTMSYAEGSRWDAYESRDSCYIGGPHERPLVKDQGDEDIDPNHAKNFAFQLVFGCQTYLTGLFITQLADGIMGMDMHKESFWNQMYTSGKLGKHRRFSLCFSRSPTAARMGKEAGAITLGGADERLNLTPIVYTPDANVGRTGFFNVKVRKMYLREGSAGESAKSTNANPSMGTTRIKVSEQDLNKKGVIIDSGTTDSFWNSAISKEFAATYKEMTGKTWGHAPMKLTEEELHALPTILIQLQSTKEANPDVDPFKTTGFAGVLDTKNPYDVILAVPASHYMEYSSQKQTYTSRFYVKDNRGGVIGANSMMGHNIVFDADTNRVGWAESHCDYTHLLQDNGYDFSINGNLQAAPPTPGHTPHPPVATLPPGPGPGEMNFMNDLETFWFEFTGVCDTFKCRFLSFIFVVLFFMFCCCCTYCLTCCCCYSCRKQSKPTLDSYKYQQAAGSELEMVDGGGYTDTPSDDDVEDDYEDEYEDEDDESSENGHKPEFQGDFM